MKELTYLEQKILAAIAENHPHCFSEVVAVYRRCKSFDITIRILEESLTNDVILSHKLSELGY